MNPSASTLITVRVSPQTARRLDAMTKITKRSKSYLAAEAIEDYLATQEWQLKAIQEGIEDEEAGKLIPHEQVEKWLLSMGTDHELPMPQCR